MSRTVIQVEGLEKRYRIGWAETNVAGRRTCSEIVNHVAEGRRLSAVGIENRGRGVRNEA